MIVAGEYDLSLVTLSFVVASFASYAALDLGGRIRASTAAPRRVWLATAAVAMGGGIWSMHFIAMLAFKMPMPVAYDIGVTTLSLLVAIAVTGAGFHLAAARPGTALQLGLGGLFMGIGIVAMHYTGMAAMRMGSQIHYDPALVGLSVMIAIAASVAALVLAFRATAAWQRIPAALTMGVAISGMHYTGMAAATFTTHSHVLPGGAAEGLAQTNLAFGVGGVTLLILMLTLIASAFDRRFAVMAERETLLLRESEEYLRNLYRDTPLPLHSLGRDGRLEKVSDAWLQLLGYARGDALGRHLIEFMTPESKSRYELFTWPMLERGHEVREAEFQFVRRSGDVLDVLLSARGELAEGKFVRTIGGLIDITARKRAEESLRQSQRMEAVGQLTGGVAHDFNNLLMVISGAAEKLRRRSTDAEADHSLDMIVTAVKRGQTLTSQLLTFARRQTLDATVVDLAQTLPGLADMLKRSLRGDIEIRWSEPQVPCRVRVDNGELELALLNLGVNARDAMPDGGILSLSIRAATLDGSQAVEGLRGEFVVIDVKDTGVGIAPEIASRVFEPFFTTKGIGKGTGLGLSQVYGFAKQSGGTAMLSSKPGHGTCVSLYLPLTRETPATEANAVTGESEAPAAERGTVLLVEDNEAVATVSAEYLAQLGYTVEIAATGSQALQRLRNSRGYDVMLSDILMPGSVGGLELARIVRDHHPDVSVVLATGYSEKAEQALREGFTILRKPFGVAELRQVLGERKADDGAQRKIVA